MLTYHLSNIMSVKSANRGQLHGHNSLYRGASYCVGFDTESVHVENQQGADKRAIAPWTLSVSVS